MYNWCKNKVIVQGKAEDVKRYKDCLLKDASGKYYPWFSAIPFPELKNKAEVDAYIRVEYDGTLFRIHCRVANLEVIENNPQELELNFDTAYSCAQRLWPDYPHIFQKLSIFHKYFEPIMPYHGFDHYVKGKLIASGYEVGEGQLYSWEMYNYAPWPPGVNPMWEALEDYAAISIDQLQPMDELDDLTEDLIDRMRRSKCTDLSTSLRGRRIGRRREMRT